MQNSSQQSAHTEKSNEYKTVAHILLFVFCICNTEQMDVIDLRRVLMDVSADIYVQERPLLAWAINDYRCVRVLLESGANPNAFFEWEETSRITPLYLCREIQSEWIDSLRIFKKTLKKDMRQMLRSNIKECKRIDRLIRSYGGKSRIERDYICIDISST